MDWDDDGEDGWAIPQPHGSDRGDSSVKARARYSMSFGFFPLGGLIPASLAPDSDEEHLDAPGSADNGNSSCTFQQTALLLQPVHSFT